MKEVKAIIQPFMLDNVVDALVEIEGLPGVSVSHVRRAWGRAGIAEKNRKGKRHFNERTGFDGRRRLQLTTKIQHE